MISTLMCRGGTNIFCRSTKGSSLTFPPNLQFFSYGPDYFTTLLLSLPSVPRTPKGIKFCVATLLPQKVGENFTIPKYNPVMIFMLDFYSYCTSLVFFKMNRMTNWNEYIYRHCATKLNAKFSLNCQ